MKIICIIVLYFTAQGEGAPIEVGKFNTVAECEAYGKKLQNAIDLSSAHHTKVVCK